MKKKYLLLLSLATASLLQAQDTLYVFKQSQLVNKHALAQTDSITYYQDSNHDSLYLFKSTGAVHQAMADIDTLRFTNIITQGGATVTDAEGNKYETLILGTQTWMAANLNTTKYNDGTAIPNVTDNTAWAGLSTGAYCNYNNDVSNATTYGRLYNWYAVNTGKLCPSGWHVPSDAEWTTLQEYLIANGYNYDGTTTDNKIAKSMASTTGWTSSTNEGAIGNNPATNNKSGLTAFPGGYRSNYGAFLDIGSFDIWWSSTENSTSNAYYGALFYDYSGLDYSDLNKVSGFSVRCLRN